METQPNTRRQSGFSPLSRMLCVLVAGLWAGLAYPASAQDAGGSQASAPGEVRSTERFSPVGPRGQDTQIRRDPRNLDALNPAERLQLRQAIANSPVLDRLNRSGARITPLGRSFGMTGWLVEIDDEINTLYITPDGRGVVSGIMLSPDGASETSRQLETLAASGVDLRGLGTAEPGAAPPYVPKGMALGDMMMEEFSFTAYIPYGNPIAPPLYIVVDLNCIFCKSYWQELQKLEPLFQRVNVRLIPVGWLNDSSTERAARLLADDNPFEAWEAAMNSDYRLLDGQPTSQHFELIEQNETILKRWNLSGTPFTIFRDHKGEVKLFRGEPANVNDLLNAVRGPIPAAADRSGEQNQ